MASYLLLAILTSLLFVLKKAWTAYFSPLAKVPGPWYTRFTALPLMYHEFRGRRRTWIHGLHGEFGGVVRLAPQEVGVLGGEEGRAIYEEGGSGFEKTGFYSLFMQFGTRTMFSTLERVGHAKKKRSLAAQYSNTNVLNASIIDGIKGRSEAFLKKCVEVKGSVDVYVLLHCYALDCVTHFLFGEEGTKSIEGGKDREMMEELSYHESLKENLAQYYFPQYSWLLSKVFEARPSPIANNYVLKHSKTTHPEGNTLLYTLKTSKQSWSDIEVAAESMDHLAAGIDTTGDALCFLMYHISLPTHLAIQDRLYRDLQSETQDSPYLDAVVKESLRMWPPIPMSMPRFVPPEGRVLSGYEIPGGTIVSCQAWSAHRLNEEVFPDGERFVPERWLDEERKVEMERCFLAFGRGARGCTGRHLAMAEMKILLRDVYSRFRTVVARDMESSMELDDQIISSRPVDQCCKLVFEERLGM
ncbi:hypothetical protein HYFRA_00009312 [Hymenoscyphus fraxineus]|uniref:Cytochrome P450 n=1 Tax=Hymenoscyphus fraxineus TaxID=746836 RepID=A0A9N9PRN3_9HELO|nr:hypothetical protein HYFRA_00009312 [Hymenoscyphus fraxineus]